MEFLDPALKDVLKLAEDAVLDIARLDTAIYNLEVAEIVTPAAVIKMIANKEANTSSIIERTQTVIEDAFINPEMLSPQKREDAEELQSYIHALDYAVDKLSIIVV